jgi:hypothetical protein
MRPATPRRRLSAGLAAVAAVVMIVVAAAIVATLFPRPSTTVATSPTAPAPVPPLPDEYLCGDTPIPIAALEARQAPDTLDEDALAALAVPEVAQLMNDPDDWIVVSRTPDEVMLLTDIMHAQWMLVEFAPIPTHEILTVFRSDGAWHYGRWEPCTLAQEHDGLAVAGVGLDPEHPPTPESTRLHLLVMERACNSGQDARRVAEHRDPSARGSGRLPGESADAVHRGALRTARRSRPPRRALRGAPGPALNASPRRRRVSRVSRVSERRGILAP